MEDLSLLEKALTGLGVVGIALLGVWNRILAVKAKTANTNAEVATAMAGETVFTLVSNRLETVEAELTQVRAEQAVMRAQLREKDTEVHLLKMHIVDLENCLRQHGIEPPAMRSYDAKL